MTIAAGVSPGVANRSKSCRATSAWSAETPVTLLGPAADWFDVESQDEGLLITPREPLAARCLIRPAALFDHPKGFPELNRVMGRLLFQGGTRAPQTYRPFTKDVGRRFREVLLTTEITPDDALPASAARWRNEAALAGRLLDACHVPWAGLRDEDIDSLLMGEPWLEPLEGCLLHAFTRWTHETGTCVMEIGSLRGLSTAMLARALGAAGSASLVVSIDPHGAQPANRLRVSCALADLGMADRLMALPCTSDQAWRLLRPASAGLIFIDGDHSYRQVVADYDNYHPLLAPGGVMVFHDYGYGDHNGRADVVPDVRRAIDKVVLPGGVLMPLCLGHTLLAFRKQSA